MSARSPHAPDAAQLVIIGGGISGLSAAFYAQRAAQVAGLPLRCVVVERDARFGGKLLSETVADPEAGAFVIEGGPDSMLTQKPWGVQLARELGLGEQLEGTLPARPSTYVLLRGRPRPLPEGLMLVVPTRMLPFALSPVISPAGKLRMALDWLIPPRRDPSDETLADFIRRRLGVEALDKIAEPLMAGIHSAEAERQSMQATFPRLIELERQHGSLIRGMLAQRAASRSHSPTRAPASPFVTLRGGIGTLVEALVQTLDGHLLCGRGVAAVTHDPTAQQPYRVRLDDGGEIHADALIMAAPAFAAAALVAPFQPELARQLRQIRYVTSGTISLAYRRADLGQVPPGHGLVIPRSERRRINACTITSHKFAHRAPDGRVLIRVFFGGSRTPEAPALDDTALLALARAELRAIYGITAEPLLSRIYRWPDANPQYDVGHLNRVDALEALCPPGLHLCGSAYRGPGIPDCVRQAQQAAERAVAELVARATLEMRDER